MSFGDFRGQNLSKQSENEIFDFSVKSHINSTLQSFMCCSTKTCQIWYRPTDN